MKLKKDTRVIIKETTAHGDFQDALYYDKLPDDKEIEKDAQKRIDDWVYAIENPPEEVPLTKEELEKEKFDLEDRIKFLDKKIAEITVKG
jgi:hypothetical protein